MSQTQTATPAKRASAPARKATGNAPPKSKAGTARKTALKPAAAQLVVAQPVKKPKLVRDSFTLPQQDHDLIKQCKKLALGQGRETKKSEVLRAAIQSFALLSLPKQMAAYRKLESIAVGRPKSA